MNLKQKYRICRNIRYILFLPLILVFGYLAGALVSMILLLISDNISIRIAINLIIALFVCIYFVKYLYARYKQFKYSNLFIKNPKLSVIIFCIENLSSIILYASFLYFIAIKYLYGNSEYINTFMGFFGFLVAPVCMLIFVITYMLNERKF